MVSVKDTWVRALLVAGGLLATLSGPAFAQVGTWSTKAPLPERQTDFAGAVVNGMLYVVGGLEPNLSNHVYAYDPILDVWTQKAGMPSGRLDLGLGAVGGVLYAVGGGGGCAAGICADVEAYDTATNTWTVKASMPTARDRMGVGVANGIVYAIGGYNPNQDLAVVEAYDPGTDSWTMKAPMPTPRKDFALGTLNGKFYAVGGAVLGVGGIATVEEYDPATNEWTARSPFPVARFGLRAATAGGVLYVVGGDYPSTAEAYAYNPTLDTWTAVAPMLTARYYFAIGEINGVVYAVGGSNNSGSQNANEAFSVGLACDIQMTGSAYLTGEVVTARVFRFANGNAMTVPIELKIWLGLPGIAPVSFVNAGGTGSLSLPPGFNQDLGPLPLFTVTPGSPRGAYELGCRILDPVTGRLLAEDLNPFTIN